MREGTHIAIVAITLGMFVNIFLRFALHFVFITWKLSKSFKACTSSVVIKQHSIRTLRMQRIKAFFLKEIPFTACLASSLYCQFTLRGTREGKQSALLYAIKHILTGVSS